MRTPATVGERLSECAQAQPDATAIICGDSQITYSELEERSQLLAVELGRRGVREGSVVLAHLDRSIDLIVALAAIWKCRATYLPTEPGTPVSRISEFMAESSCAALITALPDDGTLRETKIPVLSPRAASSAPGLLEQPDQNGPPLENDAAYIIYTSGSSGAPKGVLVGHESLAYLCDEINGRYGIGPGDRVLQFSSTVFDTSLEQILVTLLNGATLVLPDRPWAPGELAEELIRHRVTVMDLTPAYWRAFLEEFEREPRPLPVRLTIVGGSALHAEDCRTALHLMPDSRLVNAYGLTETTITSCTMEISADTLPEHGPAPVGRPLPGTVVEVLDENLRPVGPGASGEVHIGGPGVARGYVSPGADHSRFREDPDFPSTRWYRTGDRGLWNTDGNLKILGRVDRQFKVRGFRVEPDEAEAALTAHPLIVDAAVKPFPSRGDVRVVAYCATAQGTLPETRSLRAFLAERLPSYMIPETFVGMASLPVAPNGKVDLNALTEPEEAAPAVHLSGEGADSTDSPAIERVVAGLWSQVLDVEGVGPHDDFFALGGNSIMAAELVAKVRASLGVLVGQVRPLIRALLHRPTLRGFALAVESARAGTLGDDAQRVDFDAETELDVPVNADPAAEPSWSAPEHALLTGATGFLGVYLLRELLTTTGATVHCLVRGQGHDHVIERLQESARHYLQDDLAPYVSSGRIVALPGDLAEPNLGLSEETFDDLARRVDVIHHPGGLVNFIYPYSHTRRANVEAVREIIRMSGRYRAIPVHYTSTMATISGFGTAGVRHVGEDTPIGHVDRLGVGYVESKWVAEALLLKAAERGLPVAIYRAADISGDQKTGAWNTATEMCAMKRFIVDSGTAPLAELPLDYTPVDSFAAAVAHIARSKPARGDVYHLTNPGKANVSLLVERLRVHGYSVREIPWEPWVAGILDTAAADPGHPMTPFAPLFIDRCPTGEMSVAEMYLETTFPAFSRDNVEAALEGSGIDIPPVDAQMLDRYIGYLAGIDFL